MPQRELPLFDELRPTLEALRKARKDDFESDYVVQSILNLSRTNRRPEDCAAKNAATTLVKLIKRAGETPWQRPFQNLRVTRENELRQSGEYREEAVLKFIGHTKKVYLANYCELNAADFTPRSKQHGKFPTSFPPDSRSFLVEAESSLCGEDLPQEKPVPARRQPEQRKVIAPSPKGSSNSGERLALGEIGLQFSRGVVW